MSLTLEIVSLENDHKRTVRFDPVFLLCAEFSGRKEQLAEEQRASTQGPDPARGHKTPQFFPISPQLLTNADKIIVNGKRTSGEVEYVALKFEGEIYITVGSDHSDRSLESSAFSKSKQVCPKVVAHQMILHRELRPYPDELRLSSHVQSMDRKVLYQSASVADLMRLGSLLRSCPLNLDFEGAVLFSGTIPTIADIPVFSPHFYFQLEFPRYQFTIAHDYAVETLPEVV
ncbi:MAG: DUF2848 family protein [Acidobacteriia bacterium]|nr:DUF2848 family protein [Terriglobia bacterium]